MAKKAAKKSAKPGFGGMAKWKGGYVKQEHDGAKHKVTLKRRGHAPKHFTGSKAAADEKFVEYIAEAKK